jgi:hypothetical protein
MNCDDRQAAKKKRTNSGKPVPLAASGAQQTSMEGTGTLDKVIVDKRTDGISIQDLNELFSKVAILDKVNKLNELKIDNLSSIAIKQVKR